VKEFLSREGRTFTVRNVDDDDAAYRELVSLGFRSVPMTRIGGDWVKGFDAAKLRQALRSASGS
jgi:glutaredoxin